MVTCSGFTDENQTEAQDTNICLCMDDSLILLKKPIHSNSGFRFDPNKFKGGDEESITLMQNYLVEKCREQGFYLRPTRSSKRIKRGKRLATLDFVCDHNAAPVESTSLVAKSKKIDKTVVKKDSSVKRRKIYSVKPQTQETCCNFQLRVFCSAQDECWYLSYLDKTSDHDYDDHNGHHAIPPSTVRVPLSQMDEDSIELALHATELTLPNSVIANLINLQLHGYKQFSARQIRYLVTRQETENIVKSFDYCNPLMQ